MAKTYIAKNGKRDIHGVEVEYDRAITRLETTDKWKHPENQKLVQTYLKATLGGQTLSGKKRRRISKAWNYRLLGTLKQLSEQWLDKPFDQATPEEWQAFYDNMQDDKLLTTHGKKFTQSTKAKFYKTVRKFAKWRYGSDRTYPEFCETWCTEEPVVTKDYLTRPEVELLVQAAGTLKVRTLIMILFDGGFRIEEFGNLRWADVQKWEGKQFYQAHVRPETSKTKKERYVSLSLCTDLIDLYKNSEKQRRGAEFKETDFLFDQNYNTYYQTITRLGKKALNKHVSPHIMRHSSATYFANVIKTYQQFCSRYGWNLRSPTAQRYYHRVLDDEVAEASKDHEIARFKTDFERERLRNQSMEREVEKMAEQMLLMKKQMLELFEGKLTLEGR